MNKTILVADDEPEQLLMIESLLKERGYEVIVVSDGRQAVEKTIEVRPDLVILDIMMPEMDGTEAAMALKNDTRTREIPLFFVTAVIAPEDKDQVKGSANQVFAKPVKFSELLEAIREVTLAD